MIISKKLSIKLYKSNKLKIIQNNIAYSKNFDKIVFEIDLDKYYFIHNDNYFEFQKETNDMIFNIMLSDDNIAKIFLKEQGISMPILVEESSVTKQDTKLIIKYKLESDEEETKIEIEI